MTIDLRPVAISTAGKYYRKWKQSPNARETVILYNENDCFYPKYDSYLKKHMVLLRLQNKKERIE